LLFFFTTSLYMLLPRKKCCSEMPFGVPYLSPCVLKEPNIFSLFMYH
jgi:hypothetical protein